MHKYILLLTACLTAIVALPQQERIIGGSLASINTYPFSAVLLFARNNVAFRQNCGGSIINNRSVLTAAHCVNSGTLGQFRFRVGSAAAHSGGMVHNTALRIIHPQYNQGTNNNDVAMMRVTSAFVFGNTIRAAAIIGQNANIADNTLVWAIGWGWQTPSGFNPSEQLRHVQIRMANRARCQSVYTGFRITDSMICAGWEAGGRGSCQADSGSPIVLNNVVVGVTSFGMVCASPRYPTVYARVAFFTNWIRANA